MSARKTGPDSARVDGIIAAARQQRENREHSYRERALKMYPWVCGRCGREFTRKNLYELTVHHRDHNHDNNPQDGSNWELLCLYCHDQEHAKALYTHVPAAGTSQTAPGPVSTHRPFSSLPDLLKKKSG